MPRILYANLDSDVPVGGVKVIYRHVELLRELGHDAHVMHFSPDFRRCTWFDSSAPVLHQADLRAGDLVVLPEGMVGYSYDLRKAGLRYCVFVQNGYLALPYANFDAVRECYRHAEAILSISEDSGRLQAEMFPDSAGKILRVQFSVDASLFRPGVKERKATYMPRKLPTHSSNVVPWIADLFPDWGFVALDGMSERAVAEQMGSSRVFLAFSDLEGGPLPPLEAAAAGNLVLGYTGWGGDEYWQAPNFHRVEMGDLRQFVRRFREVAALADQPGIDAMLAPGVASVTARYSRARESELLGRAMETVLSRLR